MPGFTNIWPRSCAENSEYAVTEPVSNATRLPLSRLNMSPAHSPYSAKMVFRIPVPRVAVRMELRRPIRPRVGILYFTVHWPAESHMFMSSIWPLREDSKSTTLPVYSSDTSTVAYSQGSRVLPVASSFLVMTLGGPMVNSNPSRRMFSIRMVMCSAPRPLTTNMSDVSPSSTRRAKLRSSSFMRRSRMLREVTYFPSLPAKGEVFTLKVMRTVGSSTLMVGRGAEPVVMMVSPIFTSPMPENAQMSPASTLSTLVRTKLS
mmetsp:Transcript_38303/g.64341  ORF Transcript_38303/g.64341 Transcript_38303/m.64341 type:complete len:261 (+) Transcript_38303:471-1253(+)